MRDSWVDEDGAREFMKHLKQDYNAEVENLISFAKDSSDPRMQRCWAALSILKRVIDNMEAERGKSSDT